MKDRSEWTERVDGGHVKIKNRTYPNLVEFSRPCVTCQKLFSIFVTKKIADGLADSNNFGLKNCEEHRRKAVTSDMQTEQLRMVNNVMKDELAGLYAQVKGLNARLAQYELPAAMAAQAQMKMPWE